jgi:hypothetical protein
VQQVNGLDPDGSGNVEITTEDINEAAPNLYYTDARFDTRYATKTHYHNRYTTQAESERSGATATLEIYYTARPDGDGYAESEVSDVGETDTINRTLYYSDKFQADPDTAGDWTEYTTQPADNATFATAKAALLAGLNETDATAETRGTLPLSLKMVRTTTAAAADLLLDTYPGAAAAYSVRKLDKDYTGYCMKVREDSGDTEADIGFDSNGDLDTAAIATHCGSANGYVVTWYDQSGNSNNATQSTGTSQPQIYNGTAVITVESGGKPGVFCADLGDFMSVTGAVDTTARTIYQWSVHSIDGTGSYPAVKSEQLSDLYNISTEIPRTFSLRATTSSGGNAASAINANQAYLRHSYADTTNLRTYLDGSSTAIIDVSDANEDWASADFQIFNSVSGSTGRLTLSELVFWQSDQSSNRTGIETDINTYFSIY